MGPERQRSVTEALRGSLKAGSPRVPSSGEGMDSPIHSGRHCFEHCGCK